MLRITKQTDYAIVLMSWFATEKQRGIHNARDLSEVASLPLPTVSKILKGLARAGLLRSHRGVKGGYSLAREPEAIAVGEIIRAIEGPLAITECLDDGATGCDIERSCPVRANWQRINEVVHDALHAVPLTEMIPTFSGRADAPGPDAGGNGAAAPERRGDESRDTRTATGDSARAPRTN